MVSIELTLVQEIEYFKSLLIENEKVLVQTQGIELWTERLRETVGETNWGTQPFLPSNEKMYESIKEKMKK